MKKLDYLSYSYAIICKQLVLNDLKKENYSTNRQNDEINYISHLIRTSIFDRMIQDGGKKTEKGVLYKGFEYRALYDNEATPDYLDSILQSIGIKETEQLMDNTKTYLPFYVACNIIYDFEKNGYDNHFNYLGYNSNFNKETPLPNKLLSIRNDENYAKKVLGEKNIFNTISNFSTLELEAIKDQIIKYADINCKENTQLLFDEYDISKEIESKIKEYILEEYKEENNDYYSINIDDFHEDIMNIIKENFDISEEYIPVKIHSEYLPILKNIDDGKYYTLDELEDNILSKINFNLEIDGTVNSNKETETIAKTINLSYNNLGINLRQEFDKSMISERFIDQNTYRDI